MANKIPPMIDPNTFIQAGINPKTGLPIKAVASDVSIPPPLVGISNTFGIKVFNFSSSDAVTPFVFKLETSDFF